MVTLGRFPGVGGAADMLQGLVSGPGLSASSSSSKALTSIIDGLPAGSAYAGRYFTR